jgi:hypothetical protein
MKCHAIIQSMKIVMMRVKGCILHGSGGIGLPIMRVLKAQKVSFIRSENNGMIFALKYNNKI